MEELRLVENEFKFIQKGTAGMINFPRINTLKPFSRRNRGGGRPQTMTEDASAPTAQAQFTERRRKHEDRREQSEKNLEWPLETRNGRDRRKTKKDKALYRINGIDTIV